MCETCKSRLNERIKKNTHKLSKLAYLTLHIFSVENADIGNMNQSNNKTKTTTKKITTLTN